MEEKKAVLPGGKHLTFQMGDEEYGVDINRIREIIGMQPITKVPRMPGHMKGVINLRGRVIPIIDLRLRFMMPEAEYTERTCIIVVELAVTGSRQLVAGIVVDAVSEVLDIKPDNVEPPPAIGGRNVDTAYIRGIAKVDGRVKVLLDIDRVLRGEEIGVLIDEAGDEN